MANKNLKNIKINVNFTAATTRANIATDESLSTMAGKLSKWYTDLNTNGMFTHSIATNVPSNAVFTDHTYTNLTLGQGYGTCTTAAATVAKVVTLSGYTLATGGIVTVKFTNSVPASATMNVNSKGAKKIFYKGAAITAGIINAGDIVSFMYDGTQYQVVSLGRDTTYSNMTAATASAAGKAGLVPAPAAGKQTSFLRGDGTWVVPSNTDTKVTQNNSTTNSELRVLLSNSASNTNETNVVNKSANLTMNPSTGVVSINATEFGGLQINRPSDGFASVIFRNSSGKLGSVGMNTVNGYLVRHLFSAEGGPGTRITVLDTVNTTFTQTLTTGTALGTISIGDDTKTIYGPTIPTSLKNPNALTVKGNATTAFTYDGSAAKTLTIKPGTGISVAADTSGNITIGNTVTNTDTKVTGSFLAQSDADVALFPTLLPAEQTSGVYMIRSIIFEHTVGTTTVDGSARLVLGNGTQSGYDDNEEGILTLFSKKNGKAYLRSADLDNDATHILPTTGGIILNTGTTSFTQTLTSGTTIGSIKINGTTTTLYAPTNTNTTYTFAEGSTNGAFSVTPSGGSATSVKIHGLGSAAYTASTAYVSATTTHSPNTVFAGPSSGTASATATFRALVAADIPSIPKSKISDFPTAMKNPSTLTVKGNGTSSFTYDGSAAKTLNIKSGTGISVTSDTSGNITIANSVTNTDTKVTQSETTTANYRPLILGATNNTDPTKLTTTATDEVYAADGLYVQPSTGTLFTKQINVTNDIRSAGHYVPYTTGGTAGYYCAIQFKITATYLDCPIELTMSDRGSTMMTRVTVRFASANSTDPSLSLIRYRGCGMDVYACKSATSTWQIWVRCPATYSRLTVHDVYCSHMSKMTISYPNTFMTTSAFTAAIAADGSLATNAKATIGSEYYVGASTKWVTGRNINGLVVNGAADRVNYGTCSTAAGTAAKTVACAGYALITGSEITVKFSNTNTAANPTLNVNSTGAKAIYYRGAAITAGFLAASHTYTFRYNGSQYELVGDIANAVQQNSLNVTPTTNQGIKLPLLLSAKSAATNAFTDSTISAVGCSSITGQVSMTGLAWLETNYYTTAGTPGRSYATICAEHFRTTGDGYFVGNALSARSLSKNPKINGVTFDGTTNMSILKPLYSGSGSATVTLSETAANYDLLIITVTNEHGKSTIFHRTNEQYVRHPYCNTPNPSQNGQTLTIIGSMMTTVSGTSLKIEVSNIIITGSGSTVTAASATRTATITEVYGLKFS